MRRPSTIPALLTVLAIAAGCAKPAFTEAVRDRYGLTLGELRRVQFFTSDEIVLRRELAAQDKGVTGNELMIRDGVRVEEVVIPKHTPGVAIRFERDAVLVAFSRVNPDRALWFAIKRGDEDGGSPELRRYQLVAFDVPAPDAAFEPQIAKGFLVSYGGNKYQVVDGAMWDVHLLYKINESFSTQKVQQSPPGWKLTDGLPPPFPASPAPSGSGN